MTDIRPVIETAVHRALPSTPIDDIEIVQGWDHNDEEALFVFVNVPPATPRVGGEKLLAAITGTKDALLAVGERRFPYLRVRYLGEDEADEGEPARASGL